MHPTDALNPQEKFTPTPKKGVRLGGSPAHQKLILLNLATQLIEHCAITTTEVKAKALRPYAEKLIAKAKRSDQHARRTVMKRIPNKGIAVILFEEFVPVMDSERAGGYIHLTRIDNRKGDNTPLMCIELTMKKVEKKAVVKVAEKTAAEAVADEAEKAAEAAAERAGEAREEGDLAKTNEAGEVAVEVGKAADVAEQVADEK